MIVTSEFVYNNIKLSETRNIVEKYSRRLRTKIWF